MLVTTLLFAAAMLIGSPAHIASLGQWYDSLPKWTPLLLMAVYFAIWTPLMIGLRRRRDTA